jgi:hypothetical protein
MKECCIGSLAKYCVGSSYHQKDSFRWYLRKSHISWSIGQHMMIKIEGFLVLGVHGVSKLPILLTAIRRSMPNHEFSIASIREQMLQVIDHW